ncbi:MAG: hypothetical protein MJZ67_05265 [Bacteroidales bacterium]|nr:hypothetical protein [Bacteroidales bacterium]
MTQNILKKSFALFACIALTAAMMVGCKKDDTQPIIPDTNDSTVTPTLPETEGYVIYGDDSVSMEYIILEDLGGMFILNAQLTNGDQFGAITAANPIDAGEMQFTDIMTILMGGDGAYASYTMSNDDYDDMVSGTLVARTIKDQNEVVVEGTTEGGKSLKLYFKGQIVNLTQPTGTGNIAFGGKNYPVELATVMKSSGVYEYYICDLAMYNTMSIFVNSPMTTNTTYNFTTDENAIFSNNSLAVGDLAIMEASGEDMVVESMVTGGTVTTTVNGNQLTLNVSGTTTAGEFTLTYTGTTYAGYMNKMAKRMAKMRK